ncbi:MAG TPA: aromatic ring-hydroxylating dioxygenase subunit alpha [Polyangiaceae bacterium]|nr:aromatic ring-hydroxylating dioxygenase subunit alpha [Polyangiaceae bacterium]
MLRGEFFAAARSSAVADAPVGCTIEDQRLVIFRDEQGVPRALADHCVHRGVPLSRGSVRNGCVECPYHGWRYDGAGRCVHIPDLQANKRIPTRAKVGSFRTLESDGFIWVQLEAARAPRWPLPLLQEVRGANWRAVSHSREVACDWRFMVENVLDGSHLPFIHGGSLDKAGWFSFAWARGFRNGAAEAPPDLQVLENEAGFIASAESQLPDGGRRAFRFRMLLPSTVCVELDRNSSQIRVWVHVVPTGPGRCRVEHVLHRNFLTFALADRLFLANARKILGEDARAVELQQRGYDRAGRDWEVSVLRDRLSLLFRRLVRSAGDPPAAV